VENGADGGLFRSAKKHQRPRGRAVNFPVEELAGLMFYLHQRGVKGYLTLNTLVFAEELADAEGAARAAIRSGVDAFIVQDLGLLRLLHALCPELSPARLDADDPLERPSASGQWKLRRETRRFAA